MYQSPEVVTHRNLRHLLRSFLPRHPQPGIEKDSRATKLRNFIDKSDGQTGLSLETLCRMLALGISGAHAARLFRRQFGIGIREYAAGRRLVKAAHLLRTTNVCVKTISGNLGYRSTADFSRRFKQEFQVTPTRYRKQRPAA